MSKIAVVIALVGLAIGCTDCGKPQNEVDAKFDSVEAWLDARAEVVSDTDELSDIVDDAAERRLVLMGEASHGTAEFYDWRADLTLEIAERDGVDFVAVEGDWYSALAADAYVMGEGDAEDLERILGDAFDRWPRWMWANEQFADFLRRVREHNEQHPDDSIRIYGMDMQGYFSSLTQLVGRLQADDPQAADEIVDDLQCLLQYAPDRHQYAQVVRGDRSRSCEDEIARAVHRVRELYPGGGADDLAMRKHARVVESGEAQTRLGAIEGGTESWNIRVRHMHEIVGELMEHHGDDARGVVWAHNTHVGDARATDMADRGRLNIGQLTREEHGDDYPYIVGFSTKTGEVVAASRGGIPPRILDVPEPPRGSVDEKLSRFGDSPHVVRFQPGDEELSFWADRPGQRAIGVVYHPDREVPGNYVPTNPAERYDALIYIEETRALEAF